MFHAPTSFGGSQEAGRTFQRIYRSLADSWAVYDNSGDEPKILEKSS
jgi:hypothetical protein